VAQLYLAHLPEKESTMKFTPDDPLIWSIRTFIYEHFVATTEAPTVLIIADRFALTVDEATAVLTALHEQHALFLEAERPVIRIANPFSAVPTDFVTEVAGKRYWANCAWDSLGIIVATGARSASVDAHCTGDDQPLRVVVANGEVVDNGALAHVLVPFRHWYDDMVFT